MPYFGVSAKTFGFEATAKDTFSGDDSTVAFTLSQTSATNDVEVFVGNVQQEPTVAYSISGSTLTITEAPPTGTNNIYVLHRSRTRDTILPPADLGDKNYAMSGALSVTGNVTTTGNLKINDGANIGSASDADAISIASTVFWPPSSGVSRISATTTLAPSLAALTEIDFPIPEAPPVTITTRSFKRIIICFDVGNKHPFKQPYYRAHPCYCSYMLDYNVLHNKAALRQPYLRKT